MSSVDKAAIIWSIAITVIGAGIAIGGLSLDNPSNVSVIEDTANQQKSLMVGSVLQQNFDPEDFDTEQPAVIPVWIKNNAGWWSQDLISDKDFASGIQYLVSVGIISV